MDAKTPPTLQVFRPESFFLGRTRGWGVVRSSLGKVMRRCTIVTEGRREEAYEALHFDETFTYDDGEVDEWRWAVTRSRDGRYVAAEAVAGPGIVGRIEGGDYVLSFHRPLKPEGGFPAPYYRTRFTLASQVLALKSVRVSLLGLPVATLTGFHEKVS